MNVSDVLMSLTAKGWKINPAFFKLKDFSLDNGGTVNRDLFAHFFGEMFGPNEIKQMFGNTLGCRISFSHLLHMCTDGDEWDFDNGSVYLATGTMISYKHGNYTGPKRPDGYIRTGHELLEGKWVSVFPMVQIQNGVKTLGIKGAFGPFGVGTAVLYHKR